MQVAAFLAWFVDYEAGRTPQDALPQSAADGLAFGQDYCDGMSGGCVLAPVRVHRQLQSLLAAISAALTRSMTRRCYRYACG